MSVIDGVYIHSREGTSLLAYSVNGVHSPLTTTFPDYITEDPSEQSRAVQLSPLQALYIKKYKNLSIFAPYDSKYSPLGIEEIITKFIESSESYFEVPLSSKTVSDNRATLVLILSEMLSSGFPRITEPSIIRQLLPKTDFITSLINTASGMATGGNKQSAVGAAAAKRSMGSNLLESNRIPDEVTPWEVPWRQAKVKHAREEMFLDFIENVQLLQLTRRGGIRVKISGNIKLNSKLNNFPFVTLNLENVPNNFAATTGLHRGIDATKFVGSEGRTLSFVPADGISTVASYNSTIKLANSLVTGELRKEASNFELKITTAIDLKVKEVTNLVAVIVFPPNVRTVKELSSTAGDFNSATPSRCEWRMSSEVPTGWMAALKAVAYDSNGSVVNPTFVEIKYGYLGSIPSHISIKSVNITHEQLKHGEVAPYKGIRYQTLATLLLK